MRRERNTFKTALDLRVMESGKRFMLLNQFTYIWNGLKLTVPAGFETDLASIPRVFQFLIPKLGRYNKAAVIHDYLCEWGEWEAYPKYNRRVADRVFLDGMEDLGVAKWKRYVMYWFVRVCGIVARNRRS